MTSLLDWRILEALDDRRWLARFHARLVGWPNPEQCWKWTGAIDERGFGCVRLPADCGGKTVRPHRVTWIEEHGEVHPGMVLQKQPLRECAGRWCANPACWFEGPAGKLSWWVKKGLSHPSEVRFTGNRFVKHSHTGGIA